MVEPDNGSPEQPQTKKSVCAFTVAMLPDGLGLHITPISPEGGYTERLPTLSDMRAMAHELDQELQVHMHLGVLSKMQEAQRSKGLIERVQRRFGR